MRAAALLVVSAAGVKMAVVVEAVEVIIEDLSFLPTFFFLLSALH